MRFLLVAGDGGLHRRWGEEEGEKPRQIHPASCSCLRRRVNPRAASEGGAWEDAPELFMRVQKSFPAISGVLRDHFVNFKFLM